MNTSHLPPPLLDSMRVLHYAVVDEEVRYTRRSVLYVDGKEIDPVPKLAIGRSLADDDILLLHCDENWRCLGVSGRGDVERVMADANDLYLGLNGRWREAPYTEIDVHKAISEAWGHARCSFCGRYPFELRDSKFVQGERAAICGECVVRLHGALTQVVAEE